MSKKLIYLASFVLVLCLVPTSITNATEPGFVGCWRLDEGSGATVSDSSGYGNHGTFGPEPYDPQWVPGMFGYALEFDGDDYVDVGNSSMLDFGTDNWTVTAWVKTTMGTGSSGILFGNGGDQSGGIRYTLHVKGTARLITDDDSTKVEVEGSTTVNDDVWHHLAAVRDGTTLFVYVDGEQDGTDTLADGYDLSGTTQHNAYIGAVTDNRDPTGNTLGKLYTGLIDEVYVFSKALTEDEIVSVMKGEVVAAPFQAFNPNPPDGATDVPWDDVVLRWIPGDYADKHDVYFGTNFNDVNDADRTNPLGVLVSQDQVPDSYSIAEVLQWEKTYYWRVDEVNAPPDYTVYKGDVWSFTVIDHILVEDFEDYNDFPPDEIFSTWIDGYEIDTNGALVGHDADFSKGEHIVETTIVHGGKQSMPYYYNNIGAATYSEAERAFSPAQDWTREGVGVLSLWFRGHPAYLGSFIEGPTGTYTMIAEGADIWDNSDQFHFAWKELSGAGSIVAKVESVNDTDPWAKAGVMIRDTLEPGSRHAMVVVTPGNGVAFQYRNNADGTSSTAAEESGISAPQWVKVERTIGGLVRGYYSADGNTWTQLGTSQTVTMNMPMYVGLALTSHNSGVACEAKFSNVTSDGTGQWVDEDIGLLSNEAEPMYVTVKDSSGTAATVYHDDPDASLINTWTEWPIDLKEFGDAGVVLTDVSNLAIGFGGADDPQPGGLGLLFFDDIRLYRPAEPAP